MYAVFDSSGKVICTVRRFRCPVQFDCFATQRIVIATYYHNSNWMDIYFYFALSHRECTQKFSTIMNQQLLKTRKTICKTFRFSISLAKCHPYLLLMLLLSCVFVCHALPLNLLHFTGSTQFTMS